MRLNTSRDGEDLTRLLREDHRTFLTCLASLADPEQRDPRRRRGLLETLQVGLVAHARAEEAILREALDGVASLRVPIQVVCEQHALVERLLTELASAHPAGELWLAKVTVLFHVVRQQVEDEETLLFPALHDCGAARQRALAGRFLTERLQQLPVIDAELTSRRAESRASRRVA